MNREMRRLAQKEEERAKRRRQEKGRGQQRERTGVRQFLREVRQELKKVAWPSREELTTYTVVVLVTTTVLTLLIFGMDWLFKTGILRVLQRVA